MHLHIVDPERRAAGLGTQLVRLTAVHYCGVLRLARLYCEPNAFNVALQPHPCRAPAFATCAHGYAVPVRSTATEPRPSGYTWLGAVRSSRADRLVTAMVSAAARAMTVR